MDVILKEIESEKELRMHRAKNISDWEASYGLTDAVLKKHIGANPWLNRDVLNNYKRLKSKEEGGAISVHLVITKRNTDSVSMLTSTEDENKENDSLPNENIPKSKRGRPKGTTKKELFCSKRRKQMALNYAASEASTVKSSANSGGERVPKGTYNKIIKEAEEKFNLDEGAISKPTLLALSRQNLPNLAGILLKLGTYGLLRFGVGLFLDAWVTIAPWLATIAAISALYGASCAIAQKDMKKVVAYSSISHMAYILLAAAATTRLSITAAILQMISHGLISALLFLLVGVVYKKTGSRDVDYLRGLLNPERGLPITGMLMILAAMASAGIPGMVGFIAEFLVFRGSFPIFPIQTLLCLVASGLTAVYFLLMINRVFFGRLTPELSRIPRSTWPERPCFFKMWPLNTFETLVL